MYFVEVERASDDVKDAGGESGVDRRPGAGALNADGCPVGHVELDVVESERRTLGQGERNSAASGRSGGTVPDEVV